MKITRKATKETVQIEDGFLWENEFSWSAMQQKTDYAVEGTLIVQSAKKRSGRPINLVPADTGMGWITLTQLRQLQAWSVLGEQFTLDFEWEHDQRSFNVIFNHQSEALKAEPVLGFTPNSLDAYYSVSINFIEVPHGN